MLANFLRVLPILTPRGVSNMALCSLKMIVFLKCMVYESHCPLSMRTLNGNLGCITQEGI
jgi:hypothetical protein